MASRAPGAPRVSVPSSCPEEVVAASDVTIHSGARQALSRTTKAMSAPVLTSRLANRRGSPPVACAHTLCGSADSLLSHRGWARRRGLDQREVGPLGGIPQLCPPQPDIQGHKRSSHRLPRRPGVYHKVRASSTSLTFRAEPATSRSGSFLSISCIHRHTTSWPLRMDAVR